MNSFKKIDNLEIPEQSSLDRKISLLKQLPFFRESSLETCRLYAYLSKLEHFEANDPIVVQGNPADRMFIIMSGMVSICENHQGHEFNLQKLDADDLNYFGELALLAEFDWFFTARAETEVTLLTITREAFLRVMEKYPDQMPKTVSHIVKLRIQRSIDQTHYILDHLNEDAWKECGTDK
jgi:CRP-like cAMP-binding protein